MSNKVRVEYVDPCEVVVLGLPLKVHKLTYPTLEWALSTARSFASQGCIVTLFDAFFPLRLIPVRRKNIGLYEYVEVRSNIDVRSALEAFAASF